MHARPVRFPVAALLVLGIALATVVALPAGAQEEPAPPPPPAEWNGTLRLGVFDMTNSPDSYDAIFGDLMPRFGVGLERQRGHLRYSLSLDYGTVDGERVILTGGGGSIGTGLDEELTLIPIHFTAAWRFNPQAAWEWSAGLGPSFLSWDADGALGGDSGSEVGGSVLVALRRQGAAWDFAGELRWSSFPGTFETQRGTTFFFDEDDAGGVSLTFVAARGF